MKNNISFLLEDLTYNTKYEFLEMGKTISKELIETAKKRGIELPSHDLAPFKGRYAYIDRMNLNHCTLPREEVEKSLTTLIGKAIDFDHFRKRVVGYWIDAKIEGDEIISYGIFFKGNFKEDYDMIKELMQKDILAISFEAWGNKDYVNDQDYNFRDIEFSGGGLLLKSKPAFPGSEVLDMANKERVLELAKVMVAPKDFITGIDLNKYIEELAKKEEITDEELGKFPKEVQDCVKKKVKAGTKAPQAVKECWAEYKKAQKGKEELPESARFYVYDLEGIMKLLGEVDCLSCKEKGIVDLLMVDFENNKSKIKCINCGALMTVDLTPKAKLVKKGRKIKKIALQEKIVKQISSKEGKELKITSLLKKYKKDTAEEVLQELAKAIVERDLTKDELKKISTKIGEGDAEKEITEDEVKAMIEDIKKAEEDAKKQADEAKKKKDEDAKKKAAEDAKKKADKEKANADIEDLRKKLRDAEEKLDKYEKAERDAKIKTRKDELGEDFAKDVKDEDILDDEKFETLKVKKENAQLRNVVAKAKEDGSIKEEDIKGLEIGSVNKEGEDEIRAKRKRIDDIAWGKEEKE